MWKIPKQCLLLNVMGGSFVFSGGEARTDNKKMSLNEEATEIK